MISSSSSKQPRGRLSDPGPSRPRDPRLQDLSLAALEAGLNLGLQKDESTKHVSYVWQTGSSLRRGFVVLASVMVAMIMLMLASGHWYFGKQRSVEMLRRVQLAHEEQQFQEDVKALGQAIVCAHFTELAAGMHAQVSLFLTDEKNAEHDLLVKLRNKISRRFAALLNLWKDSALHAEGEKIIQNGLHVISKDATATSQSFADNVEEMAEHVDELSSMFEMSADTAGIAYEVFAKLLKRVTQRAEGIPSRESIFVKHLHPYLENFFINYNDFSQRFNPEKTLEMDDNLLIQLNDVWRCIFYSQGRGDDGTTDSLPVAESLQTKTNATRIKSSSKLQASGGTSCTAQFLRALPQEQISQYALPALPDMQDRTRSDQQLQAYIRSVFYIEHFRRLSRSTLVYLYQHHQLHYRCTTCAPEAQVLSNVLSLVQLLAIHPRWLIDSQTVNKGIPLVNIAPEEPQALSDLLKHGKVLHRLRV